MSLHGSMDLVAFLSTSTSLRSKRGRPMLQPRYKTESLVIMELVDTEFIQIRRLLKLHRFFWAALISHLLPLPLGSNESLPGVIFKPHSINGEEGRYSTCIDLVLFMQGQHQRAPLLSPHIQPDLDDTSKKRKPLRKIPLHGSGHFVYELQVHHCTAATAFTEVLPRDKNPAFYWKRREKRKTKRPTIFDASEILSRYVSRENRVGLPPSVIDSFFLSRSPPFPTISFSPGFPAAATW